MGIVFDTSFLIEYERGRLGLPEGQELAIAAITASELLQGVHRATGAHRVRREVFVERLLRDIEVLPFDLDVARLHSRIWADLLAAGRVTPAHDLQVAATALTRRWYVATMDRRHYEGVPGLVLWESASP